MFVPRGVFVGLRCNLNKDKLPLGGIMEKERRREERIAVKQQPKGKFYLYVENRCLDVRAVQDVSPFGAGLYVDNPIDNDTNVRIKYQHESIELEVCGSVAWSTLVEEAQGPRRYLLGICLQPQDGEKNIRFFRSVIGLIKPNNVSLVTRRA